MKNLRVKLRSRAGETFAEILVALLVVALAAMLLAGMVSASFGIDKSVREMDKTFYDTLSKLESGGGTRANGNVTITKDGGSTVCTVPVDVRTEGNLSVYERSAP